MYWLTLGVLAGFLWAWGGADRTSLAWRKVGVALLIALVTWAITKNYLSLSKAPILFAGYTFGYGMPDAGDGGSSLGKFWTKVCKTEFKARVMTRFSCGLLYCLGNIVDAKMTGNWSWFALGSAIIIGVVVLFGAIIEGEGSFKVGSRHLLWEEAYIGCGVFIGSILPLI